MFKIFKSKTEKEKLLDQYKKLLEESHRLSRINRTASDAKMAEAMDIMDKIESITD